MPLLVKPYSDQIRRWPTSGRHILAQFTEEYVVVYQPYRASIAAYAVEQQRFGGEFSMRRVSWIKPNFLWMMYRSGWGLKEGQERVLALYLSRAGFSTILMRAVHSTFQSDLYATQEAWSKALARSDVRLQWDPDRDPTGTPLSRRAIQLGLRDPALVSFSTDWLVRIEDISGFVSQQRQVLTTSRESLLTPCEAVFPVATDVAARLGMEL